MGFLYIASLLGIFLCGLLILSCIGFTVLAFLQGSIALIAPVIPIFFASMYGFKKSHQMYSALKNYYP